VQQGRAPALGDDLAALVDRAVLEDDDALGRLSRLSTIVVSVRRVSPMNTGLGKTTASMPRLATSVPSVVSPTDTPIIREKVKVELTRI
jgi:hypothetical protein